MLSQSNKKSTPNSYAPHWLLKPDIDFLNHGSFGACPKVILDYQRQIQELVELEPVHFFVKELEPLLDIARGQLANFLGADAQDLVFVPNATSGVNSVVRSLQFKPGDELLVTSHEYNACRNAIDYVANISGAVVVVASIDFPLDSPSKVTEAILAKVSPRTKLALICHVTSPTGLVFPLEEIVQHLGDRRVETLIDGAHAPGLLPLNLKAINATYYTGNCHKWLCAPKGAAFLYVNPQKQTTIRPLTISHGANSPRSDHKVAPLGGYRSRFLLEFDWVGTYDPSPYLCIPKAIDFLGGLLPGGWSQLMDTNRQKALEARKVICKLLEVPSPCPESMLGAMAAIPLPTALSNQYASPMALQDRLVEEFKIQVPIVPWSGDYQMLVRISAQIYNHPHQYENLGKILKSLI